MRFALKRHRSIPADRGLFYIDPLVLVSAIDAIYTVVGLVAATGVVDADGAISAAVEQFRYRYEHFDRRNSGSGPLSADPQVCYALYRAGVDPAVLKRAERAYLSAVTREV